MKNFYVKFQNNDLYPKGHEKVTRKIKIPNVKKLSLFEKGIGLMFSSRKKAKTLLFEFEKPVRISFTSLFVFFPFMIIWLDSKNKVLDFRKVNPFEFHIPSRKPFCRVLEVPFNDNYKKIINQFVERKHLKRI